MLRAYGSRVVGNLERLIHVLPALRGRSFGDLPAKRFLCRVSVASCPGGLAIVAHEEAIDGVTIHSAAFPLTAEEARLLAADLLAAALQAEAGE